MTRTKNQITHPLLILSSNLLPKTGARYKHFMMSNP